mmetsp:Transcript_51246/g.119126  ORF Transcript_51246/g.119126 Transcript_51246/m.119126 type:complete len:90 (-) Transcript_51246:46-315(-)
MVVCGAGHMAQQHGGAHGCAGQDARGHRPPLEQYGSAFPTRLGDEALMIPEGGAAVRHAMGSKTQTDFDVYDFAPPTGSSFEEQRGANF